MLNCPSSTDLAQSQPLLQQNLAFLPQLRPSPRSLPPRSIAMPPLKRRRKFNKSLWTLQENIRYASFLSESRDLFESSKRSRRVSKINKLISQYVQSRSPDQCRSHHQKMIKYHRSLDEIIAYVQQLQVSFAGSEERPLAVRLRKPSVKKMLLPKVVAQELQLWDILDSPEVKGPELFEECLQE